MTQNNTKKIAYSAGAQMIGKLAGILVSLATVAALFEYLGIEGVGKYTTVFAFVAFFSIFADFGLQWTLIRELSISENKNKVFKNIFTFRLFLALFVHLICFAFVWLFNYSHDVKIAVGIITLAWFFLTMNSTLVGVFLNKYRMDIAVGAEVIGRIATLAIIYLMIYFEASFYIIMASYIVGNALNFFINLFACSKYIQIGFSFDRVYLKRVINQALPIGITMMFGFIYYKMDSLMLSFMKGMVDVGIYGTPYKLLEVLQYIPTMLLGAAFPLITSYAVNKDARLNSAFQKQFDALMVLSAPIVLATFVLAVPIISFIAGSRGDEFISSSTVTIMGYSMTSVTCLRILIFSVGINFFTALYNYLVVSIGGQKALVYPTIFFAVFNVILNLLLIPRFSYIGAALATLTTEVLVVGMTYAVSRRFIIIPLKFNRIPKVILSSLVMGAVAYIALLANVHILLICVLCAAIYAICIYALNVLPDGFIKSLTSRSGE